MLLDYLRKRSRSRAVIAAIARMEVLPRDRLSSEMKLIREIWSRQLQSQGFNIAEINLEIDLRSVIVWDSSHYTAENFPRLRRLYVNFPLGGRDVS